MIKPVDEIPKNRNDQRRGYRDRIRADIQEAIDKGIYKFEFVGDYNFKTLAQTAGEEARCVAWRILRNWSDDHPEYKERYKFWLPTSWQIKNELDLIRVSSVKGETPEKRRVFCEIKQDMDSIIRECAEKAIEEHEKKEKNKDA